MVLPLNTHTHTQTQHAVNTHHLEDAPQAGQRARHDIGLSDELDTARELQDLRHVAIGNGVLVAGLHTG